MAFWNAKNAAPVQSHKFKVSMDTMESFTVKSVSKPTLEISEGVYQVGNQKFKYPGIHTWGDVTITFVDDKETTRRLVENLLKMGLFVPHKQALAGGFAGDPTASGQLHTVRLPQFPTSTTEMRSSWSLDSLEKGKIGVIHIEQHAVLDYPDHRAGSDQRKADHILETWHLHGSWIKSVNFGQLDYSSDELITLEIVVAYDYCTIDFGPKGIEREKY